MLWSYIWCIWPWYWHGHIRRCVNSYCLPSQHNISLWGMWRIVVAKSNLLMLASCMLWTCILRHVPFKANPGVRWLFDCLTLVAILNLVAVGAKIFARSISCLKMKQLLQLPYSKHRHGLASSWCQLSCNLHRRCLDILIMVVCAAIYNWLKEYCR